MTPDHDPTTDYTDAEIMESIRFLRQGDDPKIPLRHLKPYITPGVIKRQAQCINCGIIFYRERFGRYHYCSNLCAAEGSMFKRRIRSEAEREAIIKKQQEELGLKKLP